jgi:hypothetical protein
MTTTSGQMRRVSIAVPALSSIRMILRIREAIVVSI